MIMSHERRVEFLTDTGIRVPAVSSDQMREIDRIATDELGPNLYQMMENAGRSLAMRVHARLSAQRTIGPVLILAGGGGNGGGGICCARHLSNHGVHVSLCVSVPDALGEVPAWQLHVFKSTAGRCIERKDIEWGGYTLIIDALIGYGLRGTPQGITGDLIRLANASSRPILALDVPSGVNATTGEGDQVIRADETLTLALPKSGLISPHTGTLFLADLGIPIEVYRRVGISYSPPFDGRGIVPLEPADLR